MMTPDPVPTDNPDKKEDPLSWEEVQQRLHELFGEIDFNYDVNADWEDLPKE